MQLKKWLSLFVLILAFLMTGCGSDGSGDSGTSSSSTTTTTTTTSSVSSILVTSSASSVAPSATATITVEALDKSGNAVSGEAITLELSDPALGSITSSVTTGSDGKGSATFTARSTSGEVSITAKSGSVSSNAYKITIASSTSPSSVSVVASPASLTSGDSSTITATVKDSSGNAVSDGTSVTFSINDSAYGTITQSATTTSGKATAIFSASGTGTATITATADSVSGAVDITISAASAVLSAISLSSAQSSVEPGSNVAITATAYDKSGHELKAIKVDFKLDKAQLASITDSVTTGDDGTASATLLARNTAGEVVVTASSGSVSTTKTITILDQSAPASITLSASPSTIIAGKTSTITATVKDKNGNAVTNGTAIAFSMDNDLYGTVSSQATTNAGTASVTFSSSKEIGTAKIIATAGSVTQSVSITVSPVAAASIEFKSVSQNPVAIKGSGTGEVSTIEFEVKDTNGDPAQDTQVRFTMSGPGGVGYLDEDDADPYVANVSTQNGVASIVLHSGYEAGVVTIKAEIDTDNDGTYDIACNTPVISIGGGVPSDMWFSVSSDSWNLPGLATDGVEANIIVRMADRFGNYDILNGQTVSFQAEKGLAVSTASISTSKGVANVVVRTQSGLPREVAELAWEQALATDLETRYQGFLASSHGYPGKGMAALLVFTKGEEFFQDGSNGGKVNGLYDTGEAFADTITEPFRDYNNDGLWSVGTATYVGEEGKDAYEDYVDVDKDDTHDDKNNTWDNDKYIFRNVQYITSGGPEIYFLKADQAVNIANGSSHTFTVLVCDENINRISDGSTIAFAVSAGKISGTAIETKAYPPFGSSQNGQLGIIEYNVTVSDSDTSTIKTEPSVLTVTATWNNGLSTVNVAEGLGLIVN